MKFIASSSLLLKNIQVLGGILITNNTLPILDYFLFDISEVKNCIFFFQQQLFHPIYFAPLHFFE